MQEKYLRQFYDLYEVCPIMMRSQQTCYEHNALHAVLQGLCPTTS